VTAPIDIECPVCKSTAGNYCTITVDETSHRVTFHHAERIDAAVRQIARRRDDPHALRNALREAVTRLEKRQDLGNDDLSFLITTREVFGL
jgi:hypothetical protein